MDIRPAITGASGFIGTAMRRRFPRHVVIERQDTPEKVAEKIQGCDAVINLAGAPILRRWTTSYRKVLWSSRIETTKRLVEAAKRCPNPPPLLSASAIGIYPDGKRCDEECSALADDFLGRLAKAWEAEASAWPGKVTLMRFGMILGKEGGALGLMLPIFRLGLGGPVGDGSMMVSWMAIDDLVRAVEHLLIEEITGPVNFTAPEPVTNRHFTKALAKAVCRPAVLPVPKFALRLLFGQGASVITASKEAIPARLMAEGFEFRHDRIDECLQALVGSKG